MVYIITDGEFVKIGFSKNPQQRIRQHQSSHPKQLSLIASIHGDRSVERYLQDLLIGYESAGQNREWYIYNEEVQNTLQKEISRDPLCRRAEIIQKNLFGSKPQKLLLRLLDDSESRISTSVVGADRIAKLDEHEESLVINLITNPVPLFENVPEEWVLMALNDCGFQKSDWESELTSFGDLVSFTNDDDDNDFEHQSALDEYDLSIHNVLRRVATAKKSILTQKLIDFYNQDIVTNAIEKKAIRELLEFQTFLKENPNPHSWDIFGVDYKIWIASKKQVFCFSDSFAFYPINTIDIESKREDYSDSTDIFSVFTMSFQMGHGNPTVLSLQLLEFIKEFAFTKGVVL